MTRPGRTATPTAWVLLAAIAAIGVAVNLTQAGPSTVSTLFAIAPPLVLLLAVLVMVTAPAWTGVLGVVQLVGLGIVFAASATISYWNTTMLLADGGLGWTYQYLVPAVLPAGAAIAILMLLHSVAYRAR